MSSLYQKRHIACPYNRAQDILAKTLQPSASSGQPQIVLLALSDAATPGVGMSKEVVVTFAAAIDPMHFDKPWSVHWHPKGGGLYPDFDGILTVRADDTYKTAILELVGTYEPPLGAVGEVFDTVVGSRIASATARELLRKLGDDIEKEYRESEHAKPRTTLEE